MIYWLIYGCVWWLIANYKRRTFAGTESALLIEGKRNEKSQRAFSVIYDMQIATTVNGCVLLDSQYTSEEFRSKYFLKAELINLNLSIIKCYGLSALYLALDLLKTTRTCYALE